MTDDVKRVRWPWWAGLSLFLVLFFAWIASPRCIFRARVAPAESNAVSHLRHIAEVENEFRQIHKAGFTDSLGALRDVRSADRNYVYSLEVIERNSESQVTKYRAVAAPRVLGQTGTRYFSIDEDGVVRFEIMRPITPNSLVLQ